MLVPGAPSSELRPDIAVLGRHTNATYVAILADNSFPFKAGTGLPGTIGTGLRPLPRPFLTLLSLEGEESLTNSEALH